MQAQYRRLMMEARRIAAKYKRPEFYLRFRPLHAESRRIFFQHQLVHRCRERLQPLLSDVYGHGLRHASKVSLDAGTLVLLEAHTYLPPGAELERLVVLVQLAGLLHDCCRTSPDHAQAAADATLKLLGDFPLSDQEVQCVAQAVRNHEAFTEIEPCDSAMGQVLTDALYDADKFRWGPDNFTHTIWYMANYRNLAIADLVDQFGWGVSGIIKIRGTFRTNSGREYGPEFIDLGVQIGKEIYRYLQVYLGTAVR